MLQQDFFVDGKYLGSGQRYPIPRIGHGESVTSYAFYCTKCGEVWARAPIAGARWQFWTVPCRKCPPSFPSFFTVPGSIWTTWDWEFTDAFPDAVLRWELDRHFDVYDRQEIQP